MNLEKMKKWSRVAELAMQVDDPVFHKFFDLGSPELLDDKIEVLEALVAGEAPESIPKYYKVLELYPEDGQIWD